MNIFILIIVILLIAVVVLSRALYLAHGEEKETKKQKNLDRIISLFEADRELTNIEVRKMLGVSSRTVVRYMDELEREGKVTQVGNTGEKVCYKRG